MRFHFFQDALHAIDLFHEHLSLIDLLINIPTLWLAMSVIPCRFQNQHLRQLHTPRRLSFAADRSLLYSPKRKNTNAEACCCHGPSSMLAPRTLALRHPQLPRSTETK